MQRSSVQRSQCYPRLCYIIQYYIFVTNLTRRMFASRAMDFGLANDPVATAYQTQLELPTDRLQILEEPSTETTVENTLQEIIEPPLVRVFSHCYIVR